MRSLIRGAVVFVGAMFLQWWWNTHFAYWGAAPQFLFVLTLLVAARRGPVAGMLAGFVWGLYLDVARAELFGASALALTFCAWLVGAVRRHIDLRAPGPLAAGSFMLTLFVFVLHGLLGLVFARSFEWPTWTAALATPFLNALTAVVLSIVWEVTESR